jgi:hypothetical protein
MDLAETISILHGYLGEGVMVSVSSEPSAGGAFPVAVLIGPLSRGVEAPLIKDAPHTAHGIEVVQDGSLNFVVGQSGGAVSGSFLISTSQFKTAKWSEEGLPRTLIIRQSGVVTIVALVADLPAQSTD